MEDPASEVNRLLRAFKLRALLQLLLLVFSTMILDGGYSTRMCVHAMTGYWVMVGSFGLRRGGVAPTKLDTFLVRTGFFLWLLVAVAVEAAVRMLFFGGF